MRPARLDLLGAMNTPLSMLITGILIAAGDLKQHRLRDTPHLETGRGADAGHPGRLSWRPLRLLGLLRFGMAAQVVLLLECCPAAAITSVFAVQFGHDEQFAAGCCGADHPAQHPHPAAVRAGAHDGVKRNYSQKNAPAKGLGPMRERFVF